MKKYDRKRRVCDFKALPLYLLLHLCLRLHLPLPLHLPLLLHLSLPLYVLLATVATPSYNTLTCPCRWYRTYYCT